MKRITGISGNLGSGKDTAADRLINKFGFTKVALADPIKRYGLRVFNFSEEQLWGPSEFRNAEDSRFQHCESDHEGDDAWMAVFRRADAYNKDFVRELFPDNAILQAEAFNALDSWLVDLSMTYPRLSPRIVLQSLGTEWGRALNSGVWINYAVRTSNTLFDGGYVYDHSTGLMESAASRGPAGVVISDVRFANELSIIKSSGGFLVRVRRPSSDDAAVTTGIVNHASEFEQTSFTDEQFNYVITNSGTIEKFLTDVDIAGFILTGSDK